VPGAAADDPKAAAKRKLEALMAKYRAKTEGESPTAKLEASDPRHGDARRLARLFASEIVLYNQQAVEVGRQKGGLYRLLKKDIDRCRDVMKQRVDEDVRTAFDYLYDEMLKQIALGDESKFGAGMPPADPPR
jgi:hypothetical protein